MENMNRKASCDELAQRFFAAAECEYLRGLPPSLLREAFFRIWTLKEAYIKAEGKGLSIPLDSFHFQFSQQDPAEVTLKSVRVRLLYNHAPGRAELCRFVSAATL